MAESEVKEKKISRRDFLKTAGWAVGGLVVGGVVGGSLVAGLDKGQVVQTGGSISVDYGNALMYFSKEQFQVVEAAVERIFPKDENGPGAKELGIAFFIDHQLAGSWGNNAKEYMLPPFFPGSPTQGYQGQLRHQQIFDAGVQGLDDYCVKHYGKPFVQLDPNQQDSVLEACEKDQIPLKGVSSAYFFSLFRLVTLEGAYADPMYGGNRNMAGWKMKHYPGNQMSYANVVDKNGLVNLEPKSLRDHLV
ncbi:dehydrogenase [Kyrpidia spormannii]|uniref:Dehydrogenase n=1 Tax=Kyrpidia spormannii TaxID=2055160 RepID=A0A2K8N696_9BACL|nr:gluconate 2-dehydrogenase subunit 3 family protein [Kyrpidia spormannii]ATY84100.1 dehydrogenase [Kyrpidia spormannii]